MFTELNKALRNAQNKCIGIFKLHGDTYLVVEEHKSSGTLTCIVTLFGLQTLTINKNQGFYVKFPNKQTLSQMMEKPLDFHNWYQTKIEGKKNSLK